MSTVDNKFEIVPLGSLANFRNGINYNKDNFGRGIKIISVKNFQDYLVPKFEDLGEINPDGIIRKESLLQNGDIIFVRSNGNRELIGRSLFIREIREKVTHSAFTIKVRFKSDLVLPQFYAYLFRTSLIRQALSAFGGGTNISNLNQEILSNLQVSLPPLSIQKRVVEILSAYDDLIENNTRRIKILEEMAQALYREWFVKFRFPGHEKVKLVESELGMVPEGWEVKKLSTLVTTQYGYTESASEDEIGPKYVRGMDINKTSYIQWDKVPFCPINDINHTKYKLKFGDIMVIRMADPGKVGIVEKNIDAVFASYLIRLSISSTKISNYFLFYFLLSDRYQGYVTGASTGTTRKSASAGVITDIDMIIPTDDIRKQFEEQVSTIRLMLNNLLEKGANLRRTRDLLLPKLISGEVDVSSLDIPTGELT